MDDPSKHLNAETYTYDQAGRLTQSLKNVGTEGCTTRIYALDEEANRTSLATRPPGTGGSCATEGGTIESHTYDPANRLTDTGVTYEAFGEISKLPASDAGGYELQSTYYANGRVHEQSQNGQLIGYELDPTGRTHKTIDTGTVNSTYTSHYAGPGDSPAWTIEEVSGHWSRYADAINGFAAVETDTSEPVLQYRIYKATSSPQHPSAKQQLNRSQQNGQPTTVYQPVINHPSTPGSEVTYAPLNYRPE